MRVNDIYMNTASGDFKLRAAALIINDGKLLLVNHRDYPGYFTIGGKVAYGETTLETVEREAYEETGIRFVAERLVFVNERIFDGHHEIVFFYLMSGDVDKLIDGAHTEKPEERMHWIAMDELESYDVNPPFLKHELKTIPETVKHIVSYD